MKNLKVRLFSVAVIIAFLVAAIVPQAVVLAAAAPSTKGLTAPALLSPENPILDTTPTYKWTKVTDATLYRYQVWNSTTLVLEKTPTSSICGATTCETSPAVTLGYNAYKWRVQAKKSGTWTAWSAFNNFTISSPGFSSSFNGTMSGWARMAGGTWSIDSSMYLSTEGNPGEWTSAYRPNAQYTDFDYSAKLHRDGHYPSFLVARAGTLINSSDSAWNPGYYFGYTNDRAYAIFYVDDTGWNIIQDWTFNSAIRHGAWNTLRVVASGNQFWFYINGSLVSSFSDDSSSSGFVGVSAYRHTCPGMDPFHVDWAKLTNLEAGE